MKRVQLLPNVITAFGLSCGLFAIFKMVMTPVGEATLSVLTVTAVFLLLAALADLLDGAVARVIKAESEFGVVFDSLADAITFGVGPAVIVLKSLSVPPGTEESFFITMAAMVFTVCGVLRLVRYNVMSAQAKADPTLLLANHKNFTGLPIPAAAAAAVSLNLFLVSPDLNRFLPLEETTRYWILFSAMIALGYLMVSRWKFPSLKSLQIRVASFRLVFLTVLSAAVIFFGILHHFPLVFFVCTWLYLTVALVLAIVRKINGKSSTTLADFEPDPDELDE